MKELSIFVDESGDFGAYSYHSPFYIISLVLHDQSKDLTSNFAKLEIELAKIGFPNHCVHAGPIIRQEYEYRFTDLATRQRIMKRIMSFVRNSEISYCSFFIEKKHIDDPIQATVKLSKQISLFIRSHYSYFLSYDIIKIYYDNGQTEVTRILASVFNTLLDSVTFKKVIPSDYRLFQAADLICTMQLLALKAEKKILSKSEFLFFEDERTLKKNYLKPLLSKQLIPPNYTQFKEPFPVYITKNKDDPEIML